MQKSYIVLLFYCDRSVCTDYLCSLKFNLFQDNFGKACGLRIMGDKILLPQLDIHIIRVYRVSRKKDANMFLL